MHQGKSLHHLGVELESKGCTIADDTFRKMDICLSPLRKVTQHFPRADLFISVFRFARSEHFHVKTSLVLMNTTLFTGEHDDHVYPAFERCVRKLVRKVQAYVDNLSNTPETRKQQKGTRRDVVPTTPPDPERLARAVCDGDYVAFRDATIGYEGPVSDRVARWAERYPELKAQLGKRLSVDDIVEEVFLNAFERRGDRPASIRFGQWLEELIDLSVHVLLENPDEEMENIGFARTLRETPLQPR